MHRDVDLTKPREPAPPEDGGVLLFDLIMLVGAMAGLIIAPIQSRGKLAQVRGDPS